MLSSSPSQVVHQEHGSPAVDGVNAVESALCYLCGGECKRALPVDKWMGSNFTDQPRARCSQSFVVCEACCYVTSRTSPVLGRAAQACSRCEGTLKIKNPRKGKAEKKGDPCNKCKGTGMNEFGGGFRNYSHLWEEGIGYVNASKGEKKLLREFIGRKHMGPWFAGIADSGQKHVLPFTTMNGPGVRGVVLFDETLVSIPANQSLIGDAFVLLTAGAAKAELLSGQFGEYAWKRCERLIRDFEASYLRIRGTSWFTLAIWLAQRDENVVQDRLAKEKAQRDGRKGKRQAHKSGDRKPASGVEQSVYAHARAQGADALAPISGGVKAEPQRSKHHRTVAGKDSPVPADHSAAKQSKQLALFGTGKS